MNASRVRHPLLLLLAAAIVVPVALAAHDARGQDLPGLFGPHPATHPLHRLTMPPGQIGQQQLIKGLGMPGYFQPVEVRGPQGSLVSIAVDGGYTPAQQERVKAGLLVGQVYRFRIGNIPDLEGLEVYPTVELINRLYPPPGMEARFPVPVELTRDELKLAIDGRYVVRVIYVEDPRRALPVVERTQHLIDVDSSADALAVADRIGRPIAILRMGSRVPTDEEGGDFVFDMPPVQLYGEEPQFEQPEQFGQPGQLEQVTPGGDPAPVVPAAPAAELDVPPSPAPPSADSAPTSARIRGGSPTTGLRPGEIRPVGHVEPARATPNDSTLWNTLYGRRGAAPAGPARRGVAR